MVKYKDKDIKSSLIPKVTKKLKVISLLIVVLVIVGITVFKADLISDNNTFKQLRDAIAKDNSEVLDLIQQDKAASTEFKSYGELQKEFKSQSPHAPNPAIRGKSSINDGKVELIDTSMDSKVIGTINKGGSNLESVDKKLVNNDLRVPTEKSSRTDNIETRTKTEIVKGTKGIDKEVKGTLSSSKEPTQSKTKSFVVLDKDSHSIKIVDYIDKSK